MKINREVPPTQATLKDLLYYDPDAGYFMWLVSESPIVKPGDIAGCQRVDTGYVVIKVRGKVYFAHRLAHLYMLGTWPADEVDHPFSDKGDNRWCRLREATGAENRQNLRKAVAGSKSQLIGAHWNARAQRWQSSISISLDGKRRNKFLGYFETALEAHHSYLAAKVELHPFQTLANRATIVPVTRFYKGLRRSAVTRAKMSIAAVERERIKRENQSRRPNSICRSDRADRRV